jgi:heme/copper-type cytochrome/quinol oxidase subunit 2
MEISTFFIYLVVYLIIGFISAVIVRVILSNKKVYNTLQEIEIAILLLWPIVIPFIILSNIIELTIKLVEIIADAIKQKLKL